MKEQIHFKKILVLIHCCRIQEFSKGNKETIHKYLNIFLRNTPDLISDLEKQIKQKDFHAVEITAHSLKAQFNFIGFVDGENYARKIRTKAQEKKDISELTNDYNVLHGLCEMLYLELKSKNNSNPNP